jgi:hypothetical protein
MEDKTMDDKMQQAIDKARDLATRISERRGATMDDLIKTLKQDEGLKLTEVKKTGKSKAVMLDITAEGGNEREALQNWSNAARRAILQVA